MNKKYLVSLYKRHGVIALIAAAISLICYTFSLIYCVAIGIKKGNTLAELFHYFTVLSGIYGEIVVGFLVAFAIEGVRRKRFTYPRWMALLHYSSVICTTLVFVFAVAFISWFSPRQAFGAHNFYLHVVCPILILTAFFMVESRHSFSLKDSLICSLPVVIYAFTYLYNVVIHPTWEDIYHFTDIPVALAFVSMLLLTFGIAQLIRWLNNKKNAYYKNQQMKNWEDDLDDVTIKIEAYGLGRYMGLHGDMNNTNLNLDLLQDISEKYGIKLEDLSRAYTKGVIDGFSEKSVEK